MTQNLSKLEEQLNLIKRETEKQNPNRLNISAAADQALDEVQRLKSNLSTLRTSDNDLTLSRSNFLGGNLTIGDGWRFGCGFYGSFGSQGVDKKKRVRPSKSSHKRWNKVETFLIP